MLIRDIDFPKALVTAQRDGSLVVFAGAGVSMGPPSDLPDFRALALRIAGNVIPLREGENLDVFLGRVEERGVNVQMRARDFIDQPGSAPRPLHELIVDLFGSERHLRIVTTNFDRHFTTVVQKKHANADLFIAPAVPLGNDFSGLVYLHGAVQKARSHLVLTDRDFGRAYLSDGWATRFLIDMFLRYTVLFVGYRHEDPVMRYLARSFVGGVKRFALTVPENVDHWANLGITPVRFRLRPGPDRYSGIDDGIKHWVMRANMGAFDHQVSIARLAAEPPPIDPEEADYLRSVFDDVVNLRFFVETALRPEWLPWAESEGLLTSLVSVAPLTPDEPQVLAAWIARAFCVDHAKTALDFVQRHAKTLNPLVANSIALQLAHPQTEVPAGILRMWVAALLAVPSTPAFALTRLLSRAGGSGDVDTAVLLFGALIMPRLELEARGPRSGDERDLELPPSLDAKIVLRGEHYYLERAWSQTIQPQLASVHLRLLPLITACMTEAHGLLAAAGRAYDGFDPMSQRRRAIEPHEQDRHFPEWGLLVDVARDTLDWLLTNNPLLAWATIETWRAARPELLTRLAIYGTARRTEVSSDDRLASIQRYGWLSNRSLKHEVFALLQQVFALASEDAQRAFIEHSMTRPDVGLEEDNQSTARARAYEQYNMAVWLRRIAPESAVADQHFEDLQQQHPDFRPRDHPDLDVWISVGFRGSRSPKTREELLGDPIEEAAELVADYDPGPAMALDAPERSGLLTEFQDAATSDVPWSLRLAACLVERQVWRVDVWECLLLAWQKAVLDDATWTAVLGMVEAHSRVAVDSPLLAARLLQRAIERKDLRLGDVERLEQLTLQLLPAADLLAGGVERNGQVDWLTAAINHPGGVVALSWIAALARRMEVAGDEWAGVPTTLRERYEGLLTGDGHNAPLTQAAFASQLHFVYRADREWATNHIVRLFDWAADPARAVRAWIGFLEWGHWYPELFDEMLPYVRQAFGHLNQLGEAQERFASAMAGVAAYYPIDPWGHEGWLFEFIQAADVASREHWAAALDDYLQSLSKDGQDRAWDLWLMEYWRSRLTSVPHVLDEAEKRAMVLWVRGLGGQTDRVVDMILAAPPEVLDSTVFHRISDSGVAESRGAEIGKLLRGLLSRLHTVQWDYGEVAALAIEALEHGASPDDILEVAEGMVRLGCRDAQDVRDRATARRTH